MFKKELISPCGINCGICKSYLQDNNKCPGCNAGRKVGGRLIRCCRKICRERSGDFCYECKQFPCDSIKRLDKRYRDHYGMSPIENLEFINKHGIKEFIEDQNNKYISDKGIFCVHDKKYY